MSAVRVRLDGGQDELIDLDRWLRAEDELRGKVSLERLPVADGDMGGVLDAVLVAVGSGGAVTVFVTSLFTYLKVKARKAVVRLSVTRADGSHAELEIDGADDGTVEATVIRFLDQA